MHPLAMQRLPLEPEVLADCLAAGTGQGVTSLLALLPSAEAARLPVLQLACREAGVRLHGGVFPRLIDQAQLVDDGVWLCPLSANTDGFLLPALDADPHRAGEQLADAATAALARQAERGSQPCSTLLLIFDGQLAHIGSLVEQAYLLLEGRVRLLGINAGSESFQPSPCLFDADTFTAGGVLGLLLPDTVRSALSLQGTEVKELYTVTASDRNRVARIDGRPAFEIYRELVQRDHGVTLTSGNFYTHAVHYPLAVVRADDTVLYRIPVKLEDDGAITCIGEIPQFSLLSVLQAPALEQMQCIELLDRALQPQPPGGQLLLFYCAGRSLHFGAGTSQELSQLQQRLQPACQAGALVLGEVGNAKSWGYPMFYNGAMVGLGWDSA